jgi:urea transport system permease protein
VIGFVWLMLQKTPLGLHVRAVTKNREMAAAWASRRARRRLDVRHRLRRGRPRRRGAVQLGNVGPSSASSTSSTRSWSWCWAASASWPARWPGASGLGVVNKLLEPAAGAVLGKIVVLIFIILFIQRRPQGIFALKGRAAEVM